MVVVIWVSPYAMISLKLEAARCLGKGGIKFMWAIWVDVLGWKGELTSFYVYGLDDCGFPM